MASPGQLLDKYPRRFGKYHLLGPLAQGGMGALYLAVTGDRGLERMMVIKTVLPHLADAEYVARFRDEAKVVVKLSHGNLIPVFDAGQVDGELFLAMDFVEGRDLRAIWNRCARERVAFPVDIAVYIVKELCRGLAYAHAFPDLQLVHRDISPPNILVSYTGEVKLTDFGLASSTLKLEKTAPGIIYGKVAYMSPEQARGEKLDGRSDQYATAIVLWELLTGRQLFPPGKEQPQDLLARARNPEVLRPSRKAPRVPAELDDIVVRALAAEKDERYATCDEMRQALQGWLAVNAPTTDATRMSDFLRDLFADDISSERTEREAMLSNVRRRAMTLPPTDELRQLVEKSGDHRAVIDSAAATAVRSPGSVGRRSSDRGDLVLDRRKASDRRSAAATAPLPDFEPSPTDSQPILGLIVDGRYKRRRADRRGRHGQGVPGRARRHRQAGRAQGPAPELQPHAGPGRAVPPRGARRVEDRPPAHRRRHRLRHHRRRLGVLRDGVSRGRRAWLGDRARGRARGRRAPCGSPSRSAARCRPRTPRASSTAISSPRTSS
jgi:serine/threonine protein kinase